MLAGDSFTFLMVRVLAALVVWLALLCGSVADGAVGSSRTLVQLPFAAQAVTAYGGYVVFSQSDADQSSWRLMVWHAGHVSALPVAPRAVPFDAEAGTDTNGRPAVVYSRCRAEPSVMFTDWTEAVGCRIYELSLLGGPERRVAAIGASGASDSTPSIWRGAIAFARIQSSTIARIYIWRPRRRLRLMPGGDVPCRPARRCPAPGPNQPTEAWVSALDLNGRELVFSWQMRGENVYGTGGSNELRIDPLARGRPVLADVGVAGEACAGGQAYMGSPNAVGDHALYVVALSDPCVGDNSFFETFTPATRRWQFNSPAPDLIGAAAQDGATTYWIRVTLTPSTPPPGGDKPENQGDCLPEHETCTLMQTTNLPFKPQPRHFKPSPPLA